jgi:putative endonuclease
MTGGTLFNPRDIGGNIEAQKDACNHSIYPSVKQVRPYRCSIAVKRMFLVENNGVSHKKINSARQGLGRTGERLAAQTLERQGYRLLEHNFRCRHGEIDLVAEDGQDLVFVEVKTRRGTAFGRPEEAVTLHKQRKLLEIAAYYLDLHSCADRAWRVDVVAVQFSVLGKLEDIRVYQHAVTG